MAYRFYTPLIHHREWARNGMVPHTQFPQRTLSALNHVYAFRRKTFATFGAQRTADVLPEALQRGYIRTGYAASQIAFTIGSYDAAGGQAYVLITVTPVGGSPVEKRVYSTSSGTTGVPSDISYTTTLFDCDPDTEYEWVITAAIFGAPLSGTVYEICKNETLPYFSSESPGALHPITDALREDLLVGLSQAWKRNGSHLVHAMLTPTLVAGVSTPPTFTTTTWTNALDGNTAVGASSAGYYCSDMEPWCRISEPTTLRVKIAAYGRCTGGSTGEARFQDSTGTRCSLTGIGSTNQWYTSTTSITSIDTVDKLDLQARVAAGGSTLSLQSVQLFCYVA